MDTFASDTTGYILVVLCLMVAVINIYWFWFKEYELGLFYALLTTFGAVLAFTTAYFM